MIQPVKPDGDPDEEGLRALNERLQQKTEEFNHTPNPAIGGFSPEMLFRLVRTEWNSKDSPLKFNTSLGLEAFADSFLFLGMRKLLVKAVEEGGLKATANGNLARVVVMDLVDDFWRPEEKDLHFQVSKRCDEFDVAPLYDSRQLLEMAGLLRLRKGRFQVPKKHHDLLKPEQAGRLAEEIFITQFSRSIVGGHRGFSEEELTVQYDAGYVLFTLGKRARDWLAMQEANRKLLHPQTADRMEKLHEFREFGSPEAPLQYLLLSPLMEWGLIEVKKQPKGNYIEEWTAIRVTAFYDLWIQFDAGISPS